MRIERSPCRSPSSRLALCHRLFMSETYALKYWWCSPPRTGIASVRTHSLDGAGFQGSPRPEQSDQSAPDQFAKIAHRGEDRPIRRAVSRFGFAVGIPSSVATCRTFMTHLPRRGGSPRSPWPARDGRRCGSAHYGLRGESWRFGTGGFSGRRPSEAPAWPSGEPPAVALQPRGAIQAEEDDDLIGQHRDLDLAAQPAERERNHGLSQFGGALPT